MNGYGLQQGSGMMSRQEAHSGPHPKHAAFSPRPRPDATAAFEALFNRYHGKVYAIAMSLLLDQRDSEKVTREVFLAVMRKPNHFHDALALSWRIYRICVNACLVRLRKNRRTKAVPIEEFLPVFTGRARIRDRSRTGAGKRSVIFPRRIPAGPSAGSPKSFRIYTAWCSLSATFMDSPARNLRRSCT